MMSGRGSCFPSSQDLWPCDPMTTYPISSPQYILLRKSLEQQFPNSLIFVSVLVAWESGGQSGLQDPPKGLGGEFFASANLHHSLPRRRKYLLRLQGSLKCLWMGNWYIQRRWFWARFLDREGGWSSQGVRDLHVCALSFLCPEWWWLCGWGQVTDNCQPAQWGAQEKGSRQLVGWRWGEGSEVGGVEVGPWVGRQAEGRALPWSQRHLSPNSSSTSPHCYNQVKLSIAFS